MSLSVFVSHAPDDSALATLRDALPPEVRLTVGPDLPAQPGYHVLVAGRPTEEQLTASPQLHTLVIPFAGLPAVTRERMQQHPHIAIHNLHHNAPPTAEMALALLLAAAKRLVPSDRDFRRHDWTPRYLPYPSVQMRGKRALILGYGAVGMALGEMLRGLGMAVRGIRRRHTDPASGVYGPEALHDLLPEADVLVICMPGTDHTEGMIGAPELTRLPRGAILVNVGRASIVDQHALYEALRDGHLHGAGLDVWYHYPPDPESRTHTPPADVPFHELDNVVLSPHRAGGGSNPDVERMRMQALAEMLRLAARGEPLPNRVSLEDGY